MSAAPPPKGYVNGNAPVKTPGDGSAVLTAAFCALLTATPQRTDTERNRVKRTTKRFTVLTMKAKPDADDAQCFLLRMSTSCGGN